MEPLQESIQFCYIDSKETFFNDKCLLFCPSSEKLKERCVLTASAVVQASHSLLPVKFINLSDNAVDIHSNTLVGTVEQCHELQTGSKIRTIANEQKSSDLDKMKVMFDSIKTNSSLTESEKVQVSNLLSKFSSVFSQSESDIGLCNEIFHEIITPNIPPIHCPVRRMPYGFEQKVDGEISKLLDAGIIRESTSPWNSGLVVVKKKDGSIRLCVDYRSLNSVTIRPIYPVPNTKQLFDALEGSLFFSSIDLSKAYYQCPMKEEDKCKTAFTTRKGQFEFNRLPFGLCGAPATFQRLMHIILNKENWFQCLVYLDDVLIFGRSFDEQFNRLKNVLTRFKDSGIKLSPQKCNFFQTKLTFLGHAISKDGIQPDPEKISKIKFWMKPQTVEDLHSFLGFTNYYRKFIRLYESLTTPLEKLFENGDKQYRIKKQEENITMVR